VTELARENYTDAEERVVSELQEMGKPFIILLNTAMPYSETTQALQNELKEKYGVPVVAVNAAQLKAEDIRKILEEVLYQFPLKELRFFFPAWVETLEQRHWLKESLTGALKAVMKSVDKLADVEKTAESLKEMDFLKRVYADHILPGEGAADMALQFEEGLFYKILSETVDLPIEDDYTLIQTIKMLSEGKREYDKISAAMQEVKQKGYGVVAPVFEEITLEKPEVFKQGSRYGIRLKAKGESVHMIRADVETEVSPIIGNEEQSREFINHLIADYEEEPEKIWDLNIFGRTLSSMVSDGMQNKIYRMPEDAQMKLQETLQKIVNEGSGGLICIIL
jgi:stage IV sporulation protein A